MRFSKDKLKEYSDPEIRVKVPSFLRQKKGLMLFETPRMQRLERSLAMFSATVIHDLSVAQGLRNSIVNAKGGIRQTTDFLIIRGGVSKSLENGHELLASLKDMGTGEIDYNYAVLFELRDTTIYSIIIGAGSLARFENNCRLLIRNIKLKTDGVVKGKQFAVRPTEKNDEKIGLKQADKIRLFENIKKMPPQIAYLRESILAIAQQDQDLLGCGEADTRPVLIAFRKAVASGRGAPIAKSHADVLHAWLAELPDNKDDWAAPAWFVEGFLRGVGLAG